MLTKIKKRDGRIVKFDRKKIYNAIFNAMGAVGKHDKDMAEELTSKVIDKLKESTRPEEIPAVEHVQDIVEATLVESGHYEMAKEYILYRELHKQIRGFVDEYLMKKTWLVKENSNMGYSLQALNLHISSQIISNYWLHRIYKPLPRIRDAHLNGEFHIHDLAILGPYCVGWDVQDLLMTGFKGVRGKISSRPAKHFRVAMGQIVNFFFTMQGEAAGAQAFSNFDTYLAPFIRYDNLDYKSVKQSMQEFMYNINVPTRVGFQCMSEDTEILTESGWKKHHEVAKGDIIATFNTKGSYLEYLPVKKLFSRNYKGKMYNIRNRITDQLLSPRHRIVRKKFNSVNYVLEPVEKVVKLKSPVILPVGSEGNVKGSCRLSDSEVRLIAWVVSEGSIDKGARGNGRIIIYQSKLANLSNYEEIRLICGELGLKYTERTQKGLGRPVQVFRFDSDSTKKTLKLFGSTKTNGIKFIPDTILNADAETSRLFIETYMKGDGHENCKITTSSKNIRDSLMHICANAGYGTTVANRKSGTGTDLYIIRIIYHNDTYVSSIDEVEYDGIIWCPNTDNETVVARRNGKVFITGNTPFTNVTLDLKIPKFMKNEPVSYGGKLAGDTYADFQPEMDIFNKALAEVMMEGDSSGRVFTFPIPTINVTKDFDWDNEIVRDVFKTSAKYGIPYFANFVNSDMSPDDVRSMCCRLRLDNTELRKRGGGLFGANPLTGSIGVMTINMPRIGYLSKDENEFFERLEGMMDLSRNALEIKRQWLERFTEMGLYPYSKFYLRTVKEATGEYWKNHFSTIGLIGMNEACMNFMDCDLSNEMGINFAEKVLKFMRSRLQDFQKETGFMYNLEATPAEGTSYRLARIDKKEFPKILVANEKRVSDGGQPYYTNSTQLPVFFTDDLWESLRLQEPLQTKYTGGTVFHVWLGESNPPVESIMNLMKKVVNKSGIPYFTLTPTFSVCDRHGYLKGEQQECPKCRAEGMSTKCEVYSRVVGYLRPVDQWNDGKQEEFRQRMMYDKAIAIAR